MKKIFTFMLMLAFALFAGVSCTNDQTGDDPTPEPTPDPVVPVVTVTGAPEANLTPEAGEFTLNYAVENPATADYVLDVTTEATWLTKGEVTETSVTFAYSANTDAPGMPAREAAIVFATEGAESVTVTVKQDTATATFSVEFSEVTPSSAVATLTSTDPEIDWIAVAYPTSTITDAGCANAVEYATKLYETAKEGGYPYLDLVSETYKYSGGMGKGSSEDPIRCMMPGSAAPTDKLYLVIWGFTADADMNNWEYDNSVLKGPIHVFEVPLPAKPVVTLAELEKTVTSAEGSLALDLTVENPMDGAYVTVKVDDNVTWVTPTYADGKLTLAYKANTTALSRNASVYVDYVMKNSYGEPGTEDYYEWEESLIQGGLEFVLTQEKDANVEAITFTIEVVEEHNYTHFDRVVVNVTPSNENVHYVLATESALDWWGDPVEVDWAQEINETYSNETNTFQGKLTNHSLVLNVANYVSENPQFHVYAFALNEDKSGPASEASHVLATVDLSDMPKLEWVVENGVYVSGDYYKYTATPESTLTFKYNLTNPVEGAVVSINGDTISDNNNVIDEDATVIDTANQTITLKTSAYHTAMQYHYVRFTLVYGDSWGIQTSTFQVDLEPLEANIKTLPFEETFADGQGDFMINNNSMPSELSYVWKHDTTHKYMKASSYKNETGYSATSYLASPIIDLSNATAPALSFVHAVNYAYGQQAKTCKLMIKTLEATSWTQLTIPNHGTGNSWDFVDSGLIDLSAYAGKKVVIAFMYSATTDWTTMKVTAPTWEVKNLVVTDAGGAAVMPDMDL